MDCRECVELVTAYLEGELDQRQFVAHVAGCEGCRRYPDQIRQPAQRWDAGRRIDLADRCANTAAGSAIGAAPYR